MISAVAFIFSVFLLPVGFYLEKAITSELKRYDIEVTNIKVEDLSYDQFLIKDVVITAPPITIPKMVVHYSLFDLITGERPLSSLLIEDPVYTLKASEPSLKKKKAPFVLTDALLEKLPFKKITLSNAVIQTETETLTFTTSFLNKKNDKAYAFRINELRWRGGFINIDNFTFNSVEAPIRFKAHCKNIPLPPLLSFLSAENITATGELNGTLPITIKKGDVFVEPTTLQTATSGTLSIAPAYAAQLAITNPALKDVSEALSTFNYSQLSLKIARPEEGNPSVKLHVRGNNRNAFNGRPIDLNINIGGDLESLLKSSLQLWQNPNTLLRGESL